MTLDASLLVLVLVLVVFVLGWTLVRRQQGKVRDLRDSGVYPHEGTETDADVDRLLLHGQKIAAIKVYRAVHRVGLKEAKEAVEERQRGRGVGQ
jgi:hypothetical protein